mgnify:CR=1 FL=1
MIIKICGMRDAENIRAVEEQVSPDYMGFIFYEASPRYVAEKPSYLPTQCKRTGVFVNATFGEIMTAVRTYELQAVQLHGEVFPEQCRKLRECGLTVIRALPASTAIDADTHSYEEVVDFFLFDTPTPQHGGSGKRFDWHMLESYHGRVPFLLSGGLNADALDDIHHFHHPRWAGIDLNSGFEAAPAMKNVQTLKHFVESIRKG